MVLAAGDRQVYRFQDASSIPKHSLRDLSLTAIAQAAQHRIQEYPELFSLPDHLKQFLLSYIAACRTKTVTADELRVLFGSSQIHYLDLSYSVGLSISLGELANPSTKHPPLSFSSLTHLCLAHPGSSIWQSLLSFVPLVPWITHLSLAYWPHPGRGMSQVASRASVAAWVLSRLSEALQELRYLDLEGCTPWISALCTEKSVDWTKDWKNLRFLNLSQGPMPIEVQLEGGPETEEWIKGEVQARHIEETINQIRQSHGMFDVPLLHVEHGWNPRNAFLKTMIETIWHKDRERRLKDCRHYLA